MIGIDLSGRHALVTGGAGTIGRAFAAQLRAAGARVSVLERPGLAGDVCVDLADAAATEAAVGALVARAPVDILINNAALILNRPWEEFSAAEFDTQMRINATAAFALARVCAPGMKTQGWGRIVNLTSVTLNGQWGGFAPYVATKGAVLGLTRGLARELGPHGITVNAIAPGAVRSEVEDRVFADDLAGYQARMLAGQAIKRRIEAEDIAALAVFLCSDGAAMLTGQNIGVDGGW